MGSLLPITDPPNLQMPTVHRAVRPPPLSPTLFAISASPDPGSRQGTRHWTPSWLRLGPAPASTERGELGAGATEARRSVGRPTRPSFCAASLVPPVRRATDHCRGPVRPVARCEADSETRTCATAAWRLGLAGSLRRRSAKTATASPS